MFKTKKDVDGHVQLVLRNIKSPKERSDRHFTFAKLYFGVSEYEKALEYAKSYIAFNSSDFKVYNLIGQCYEKLGQPAKALEFIEQSLEIQPNQRDVIFKMGQLLMEEGIFNKCAAERWIKLAENEDFKSLRLKIADRYAGDGTETVLEILHKALNNQPNNIEPRLRLLEHYIKQKSVREAFRFALNAETKVNEFLRVSLEWYNQVAIALRQYEESGEAKDWDYYLLSLICCERQAALCFQIKRGCDRDTNELAAHIFDLDQQLYQMEKISETLIVQPEFFNFCLNHYRGQLMLHMASLLLYRELQSDKKHWKVAMKNALPLMMLGYRIKVPDSAQLWLKHSNERAQILVTLWTQEAAFRCLQLGRTLLACIPPKAKQHYILHEQQVHLWRDGNELLNCVREICVDKNWRQKTYQLLFTEPDQKLKHSSSMFITSAKLNTPYYELPNIDDIPGYAKESHNLHPQLLSHQVYVCLANHDRLTMPIEVLKGLKHQTHNLAYCAPESLSSIDAFIYLIAVCIQAGRQLEIENSDMVKPIIMPYGNMSISSLYTSEQEDWWLGAYKKAGNIIDNSDSAELRALLQRGMEAVRGLEALRSNGGPRPDLFIVLELGSLLSDRISCGFDKQAKKTLLCTRAESIYKLSVKLLKERQNGCLESTNNYFFYLNCDEPSIQDKLIEYASNAISFLSDRYFKRTDFEDFINLVNGLNLPMAAYLESEAYGKLLEYPKTSKKLRATYLKRRIYSLEKARQLLSDFREHHYLLSVVEEQLKRVHGNLERSESPAIQNDSFVFDDTETEDSIILVNKRSRHQDDSRRYERTQHFGELDSNIRSIGYSMKNVKNDIDDIIKPELNSMRREMTNIKDDVIDVMKPALSSILREITSLKDRFYLLDESMKKLQISESKIADIIQNSSTNSFAQNSASSLGYPGPNLMHQIQQLAMQQFMNSSASCMMAPPSIGAGQPRPANMPINYYGQPPYLQPGSLSFSPITPQGPYTGFNAQLPMQHATPAALHDSLIPNANSNTVPIMSTSNIPSELFTANASSVQMPAPVLTSTPASVPVKLFNKAAKNQLVEQSPQAVVVMTSSDPMPKLSSNQSSITAQAQTFTVTIPPEHIKHSGITNNAPNLVSNKPITTPISSSSNFSFAPTHGTISSMPNAGTFSFKPSTQNKVAAPAKLPPMRTPIQFMQHEASSPLNLCTLVDQSKFLKFDSEISSSDTFNASSGSQDSESSPSRDFQPVIPLPPQIDVNTYQEDTDTIFCASVKLYRFKNKEWKERGKGDIKILKSKEGYARVLMRNDATHKICANHRLHPSLTITQDSKDVKSLIWAAEDFSDEMIRNETFLARFKILDAAEDFLKYFKKNCEIDKEKPATEDKNVTEKKQNAIMPPPSALPITVAQHKSDGPTGPKSSAVTKPFSFSNASSLLKKAEGSEKPTPKVFSFSAEGVQPIAKPFSFNNAASAENNKAAPLSFAAIPSQSVASLAKSPQSETVSSMNASNVSDPATKSSSPFTNFAFGKNTADATKQFQFKPTFSNSASKNLFSGLPPSNQGESVTPTKPISLFSNISNETPFSTPMAFPKRGDTADDAAANNSDVDEEYEPTTYFQPVIPLPELVEATTGEENEIVLFEHRAKLLRFNKDTSEWKERGLGNIKLLQNKNDVNQVRLVMRREQVHKLCCNQRLKKDMKFTYAKNSQTALTWAGQDFSETELTTELLCVRFKTPEVCKEFQKAVETAQGKMTEDDKTNADAEIEENETKSATAKLTESDKKAVQPNKQTSNTFEGFGDKFKPKSGSWTCEHCYLNNAAEAQCCNACEKPKENEKAKKETSKSSTQPQAQPQPPKPATIEQPKSEQVQGFGEKFKPKAGSWSCQSCYLSNDAAVLYCSACEAPKDDTVPPKKDVSFATSQAPVVTNFSFGFKNNALPVTTTTTASATNSTFSFGLNKNSAQNVTSSPAFSFGLKPAAQTSTEESSKPDLADSGRHDVLFRNNAVLCIFNTTGWQQRASGTVKILRDKNNSELRVVFCDHKSQKCLDHVLDESIAYKLRDKYSWQFEAVDTSKSGQAKLEHYAMQFENKTEAASFLGAIKCALSGIALTVEQQQQSSETFNTSDSTAQLPLALPELNIKNDGVASDSILRKSTLNVSNSSFGNATFGSTLSDNMSASNLNFGNVSSSSINPDQNITQASEKPANTFFFGSSKDNNTTSVFGKNSSIFGSAVSTATSGETKSIFGGAASNTGDNKWIFGGTASKTLFGSTAAASKGNIFGTNSPTSDKESSVATKEDVGKAFITNNQPEEVNAQKSEGKISTELGGAFDAKAAASVDFASLAEKSASNAKPIAFGTTINNSSTDDSAINANGNKGLEGFDTFTAKAAASVDFASLAAQLPQTKGFEKPATGGFFGLKNQDAFKNFKKPTTQETNKDGEDNTSNNDDSNAKEDDGYDPHYDPIIALPDKVVVSTGEEDETKIFGMRAVLYRYDNGTKEWKQRGVGEIKVLHHPEKKTFRLIMRRDQIHKLVVNFPINADFSMSPMGNSPKSFAFAGLNFAEEPIQGQLESLAIRFKKEEEAEAFSKVVNNSIATAQTCVK